MTCVIQLIEAVRANPMLGVGIAVGIVALLFLLNRQPRLQREADKRLASIRREKAEQAAPTALSRAPRCGPPRDTRRKCATGDIDIIDL